MVKVFLKIPVGFSAAPVKAAGGIRVKGLSLILYYITNYANAIFSRSRKTVTHGAF
jgi:hypothetical protein